MRDGFQPRPLERWRRRLYRLDPGPDRGAFRRGVHRGDGGRHPDRGGDLLACDDPADITVTPEARVHLYVSDLFVAAEWRGQGVAGLLLAEAEKYGRAQGLAQMTIGVLAVNAAARSAYAKAGFGDYEMLLRKML